MPTSLATPQTLPLGYTQNATLGPIQNLEKIVWQNTGGVVVFQVGRLNDSGKVIFDQTEAVLPPGIWGLDKIYGIRFRSRDAAALATLDPCTGYFQDDPDPFNPGTIPGSTAAITGAVNIQHNDTLVASQPTIDFEDSTSATFAWTITNDGANTRVKVTPPDVVTSAFGRNGVVVATSGDYTAAQVTNAADKSSASTQTFTGDIISGTPTPLTIGSGPGTQMHTTGTFSSATSAVTGASFTTTVVGDTTDYRFKMLVTGEQRWAAANTLYDVSLSRGGITGATSWLNIGAANAATTSGIGNGPTPNSFATLGFVIWSGTSEYISSAATNTFINAAVQNDTNFRFTILVSGQLQWGPGNAASDINLARNLLGSTAILTLKGTTVDNGSLQVDGNVSHGFKTSAQGATSSYTPDALAARYHTLTFAVAGGTLTLNNPTNPPSATTHTGTLIIRIVTSATGATAMSYGSQYVGGGLQTLPATIAAATERILTFQADYTTGSILWRLVAQV